MGKGILKTLAGGAVGALATARAVTGHLTWYVRHQMTGDPHDQDRKG